MPRCLPFGWVISAGFFISIMFIWLYEPELALHHGGGGAYTYNEAVLRWEKDGAGFRSTDFSACNTTQCYVMERISEPMEGMPPKEGLLKYIAVHYDTNANLLGQVVTFSPHKQAEIYVMANGQVHNTPITIPYFTWQLTKPSARECTAGLGVPIGGGCLFLFMLDRVCVTVGDRGGDWAAANLYGDGYGCSPTAYGDFYRDEFPNYSLLGDWGAGIYTQVNASEVLGVVQGVDRSRNNSNALVPFVIPETNWTGDFSSVAIRFRSVTDPRLTAEHITNGTLNFGPLPTPHIPSSFLSTVVYSASVVLFVVSSTILIAALLFPEFRSLYILRLSSDTRRNKLQSQSRIYPVP